MRGATGKATLSVRSLSGAMYELIYKIQSVLMNSDVAY